MGFSRKEYWSGLPFPSPGDLPNPGIKSGSPTLQADALTSEPPGSGTKGLNVRPNTIKLLEENISRTLFDINHNKILCDPPLIIMEIKTKLNKWDLIKLESYYTTKETILRMGENNSKWNNWQRINLQNIQAAHASHQKNKQLNQKWTKDLNRHFSKEDIQMANKHMKRYSILLLEKANQNYNEVSPHTSQNIVIQSLSCAWLFMTPLTAVP